MIWTHRNEGVIVSLEIKTHKVVSSKQHDHISFLCKNVRLYIVPYRYLYWPVLTLCFHRFSYNVFLLTLLLNVWKYFSTMYGTVHGALFPFVSKFWLYVRTYVMIDESSLSTRNKIQIFQLIIVTVGICQYVSTILYIPEKNFMIETNVVHFFQYSYVYFLRIRHSKLK